MAAGLKLKPAVQSKLKRLRLRLRLSDRDTLLIKNVPADQGCFTKTRTNLLIKRLGDGMPCVMCVDEDLEYTGSDETLARSGFGDLQRVQFQLYLTNVRCHSGPSRQPVCFRPKFFHNATRETSWTGICSVGAEGCEE